MATTQQDLALFGREAVRTFQHDGGPRPQSPIVLGAHAQRAAEQLSHEALSPRLVSSLYRIAEFALLTGAGLATLLWADHLQGRLSVALALAAVVAGLCIISIELFQGYDLVQLRSRRTQIARMATGLLLTASVFAGGALSIGAPLDLTARWAAIWLGLSAGVLALARTVLGQRIRVWARNGVMERRAVLVGGGTAAEAFIRSLEKQADSDIRICGIFDDRDDDRSPPIVAGYPKLGSVAELTEFARLARIEMLIVTLPLSAEKRILAILKELWVLPLDIRVSALSANLRFRPRSYSYVGSVPLVDVFDRPLADWDLIAKRVLDVTVGSVALLLLSPIMLATALAIKVDTPGPVFFRQKRHGFNNQVINVWKFRSLRHDMADPTARKLVTKDDPRVTKVGRFIRRTSIDELPQLFNVITGELALVGPRPHAVHARSSADATFTEIVDGYFGRHKVKPGITGWAQIKGWRGEIDNDLKLQKRFEHDLYYIENWSILMDVAILAKTPMSLLKSDGAY
ncbi:undecaprenyl-phosphate glucose phosphotransferase [Aureimonas sp. AU12]|uniref:undecaprenyl-phosphate glucose phosphotransferase n=1 Tax=Aureimonas sp. AU12 TaxID=1638161 RepID=UPI000783DDA2|nr:undecaprenyl-phosphate glucose phosphotransferase [Aureimonas sp. AU12]